MSEWLVLLGIVLAAASGLPGAILGRTSMRSQWATTVPAVFGAVLGLAGVATFWASGDSHPIVLPWSIPGGEFNVAIDGLSALFLAPIFLISLLCNVARTLGKHEMTVHGHADKNAFHRLSAGYNFRLGSRAPGPSQVMT